MKEQILALLVSLVVLSYYLVFVSYGESQVVFFDVAQGDSMLLEHKDIQILVDGGGGDYLVQQLGKYLHVLDRKIEWVVITHMHLDHYGGILLLLDEYEIENIVLPASLCKRGANAMLLEEKIRFEKSNVYNELNLDIDGVHFEVTNGGNDCVTSQKEINNSSLIVKIYYRWISILNVGDTEKDREESLFADEFDILKAGHHCSGTSTSDNFLDRVNPKYVICSYGIDNTYGHPSPEVITRLKERNIGILSTPEQGNIIVKLSSGLIYNEDGKIIGKL